MESSNHFLGELAAFEFECSVSAAELNRSVYESLDPRNYRDFSVIRADVIGSLSDTTAEYKILHLPMKPQLANYEADIVLAQEIKKPQLSFETAVEIPAKKRFSLLKKHVEVEPQAIAPAQPAVPAAAFIAVRFGSDVLLPIATFEKRTDSESCSYVQLGSEIRGDNFYSTTLDEADVNRKQLVEDLRDYKSDYIESNGPAAVRRPPESVAKLIESEITTHGEKLTAVLEKQLVQSLSKEFDENRKLSGIFTELRPDTEPRETELLFKTIGVPIRFGNSLTGLVIIARDVVSGEETFGVTARRSAYIPLARIVRELDKFEPIQVKQLSAGQLQQVTKLLQEIPKNALKTRISLGVPNIEGYGPFYDYRKQHEDINQCHRIAGHLMGMDVIRQYDQVGYNAAEYKIVIEDATDEIEKFGFSSHVDATAFMRTFGSVLRGGKPFLSDNFLEGADKHTPKHSGAGLLKLMKSIRQYVNGFSADANSAITQLGGDMLDHVISPQSESAEHLIERLADMSLLADPFAGVLHNVIIGSTTGDLSINASVDRQGSRYTLSVHGRPSALESGSFSKLYECSVDIVTGLEISEERTKDLHETLNIMKPTGTERLLF